MEKIQIKNGLKIREIDVYIKAVDNENPPFMCWLTFVQDVERNILRSADIIYKCGKNEYHIETNYNLEFFDKLLDKRLQRPGDIIQGDYNSYAAAVTEYVTDVILEDCVICNGIYTVIRVAQ